MEFLPGAFLLFMDALPVKHLQGYLVDSTTARALEQRAKKTMAYIDDSVNMIYGQQNACNTYNGMGGGNQFNQYMGTSTAVPLYRQPAITLDHIRQIVREEFSRTQVLQISAPPVEERPQNHEHFMIHGMRENYCLCGYRVPK